MDYAALPPEVNSGRMYTGAGSMPLMAAASAWDGLALDLSSAASSYQSVVSELGGSWVGPSSNSMAAAAAPYVAWLSSTSVEVERAASQARAAAAAYEAAFSATVPPPVIAANRSLLASLVATNFLGQNTPAILTAEGHYAEMWAQDATAMYGYAVASATATTLTPFNAAPETTNPSGAGAQATATSQAAGTGAQSAASQMTSAVPQSLAAASTNPLDWNPFAGLTDLINEFNGSPLGTALQPFLLSFGGDNTALSGSTFYAAAAAFLVAPLHALALPMLGANGGLVSAVTPAAGLAEMAGGGSVLAGMPSSSGMGAMSLSGADVSAGLGRAASISGLSVPQSWAGAAPEIQLASAARPLSVGGAGAVAPAGAGSSPGFCGVPPIGSVVNAPRNGASSRYKVPAKVIEAMPEHPRAEEQLLYGAAPPGQSARFSDESLTDHERAEIDRLQSELADLVMERDAAARLIKEAIR